MGLLIVTGVGRCGTSMLMQFLTRLDFDIGSTQWFDRVNAGLENKETLVINSEILRNLIKGEHVNMWHIWGDIHDLKYDAVKDPQFLSHPAIIKNWWHVRKDIKVVFMYRNVREVVESMKRHPEWNTPVYRLFPEMIEEKNDAFLRMCEKLEIPLVKIKYPHVINNAEMFGKLMEFLPGQFEGADKIWNDVTGGNI
jgi:hypothetical protein